MAPASRQGEGAAKLLIVDNDGRIVELVAWFLEKRGYRVRSASSFAEARELITESPPDLMLSDVDLDTENAREELPRLAGEGLLPPTLVVSGYLAADVKSELEALPGVFGSLAKPFSFTLLEERILECLELSARSRPALAEVGASELEEDEEGWIEIVPSEDR